MLDVPLALVQSGALDSVASFRRPAVSQVREDSVTAPRTVRVGGRVWREDPCVPPCLGKCKVWKSGKLAVGADYQAATWLWSDGEEVRHGYASRRSAMLSAIAALKARKAK